MVALTVSSFFFFSFAASFLQPSYIPESLNQSPSYYANQNERFYSKLISLLDLEPFIYFIFQIMYVSNAGNCYTEGSKWSDRDAAYS